MAAHLRRSLVALAALAGLAAQREPRTLRPSGKAPLRFSDLIEAHLLRQLGGSDAIVAMPGAEPLEPAVYVTLRRDRILVWDQEIVAPTAAELSSCPPAPLCFPRLRAAAERALAAEAARLLAAGERRAPRVLVIADGGVPFQTFLATAYSLAVATEGGPPALRLVVRPAPPSPNARVGAVPFFLSPPHGLKIAQNANPLLLHISLEPARYLVRAHRSWLPVVAAERTIAAAVTVAGELKARDTTKTIVFIDAPAGMPLSRVLEFMAAVRVLFPNVTFGGLPRVTGPTE